MKDAFVNDFCDNPSYRESYFNDSNKITDIQVLDTKYSYIKTIWVKEEDGLKIGDIIEFDNKKWICEDANFNGIHYVGTINECKNVLTLNKNGVLYQIPYAVLDNVALTRMREDDNKFFSVPESMMMIMVADTEITRLIQRNEKFTLYNNNNIKDNYKIIDINRVRKPGLIIFELAWVATDQQLPNYELIITNGDNLEITLTQTIQLNVQVFENGKLLSPTPSQIIYKSSDNSIAEVDNTGLIQPINEGDAIITVKYGDLSTNINISVVDDAENNYIARIVNSPTSIVKGWSENFIGKFYNNGIDINTEETHFYLTADDGVSDTTLATITYQDTNGNCTILAGNKTGYVKLWFKNTDESIVSEPYRIKICNIY